MPDISNIFALFPGQGSQKVGMGKDLAESSESARELFAQADKILGFALSKICFEGPAERLTETSIAQPAILVTSIASFQLANQLNGRALNIGCAAGHSLGEYSALVAAGALKFEDAVMLVHKRGRYMQEAVPVGHGKMVAVIGAEVAQIESALKQVSSGIASIANINAPGQIVVAGDSKAIDEFVSLLEGIKTIPLQVSAPFHCQLMKPAEEKLAKDLAATNLSRFTFPVISNASSLPNSDPAVARQLLIDQVCGRVRWVESCENAMREFSPSCCVEFGMGNVLTGLAKRTIPSLTRVNFYSDKDKSSLLGG